MFQPCICFGQLRSSGEFFPGSEGGLSARHSRAPHAEFPKNIQLVEATSRKLDVPRSRMCVVSLSRNHPWELSEYGGLRVIM